VIIIWASVFAFVSVGCSSPQRTWTHEGSSRRTATLSGGKAIPPKRAPRKVVRAIEAANRIVGRPYRYGGGHARVEDFGYDCSGTVSYALVHAGLLDSPLPSSAFRKYGRSGEGDWITIYAWDGHVFADIAGLRLDTGYSKETEGPVWTTRSRPFPGRSDVRHPPGL
jgi:hypothetical protein